MAQIRSEDWFVTIDLKDAYFHISILPYRRKFLRFAFGGRAYQHWVLPFCLPLSPRTFTKCVDAALEPLCLQGICIMNYIDDWLILAQSHQAAVRHRDVMLAHMKVLGLQLRLGQSLTVKQFQRLLGLMAAASNVIAFGLLYMRHMQWWLRTKGFPPRGNPFSHNQGHAAMLTCLGNRHILRP